MLNTPIEDNEDSLLMEPGMSDDDLRALIESEAAQATLWSDSTIASEQERNLRYYLGLPQGNEVEGRSQTVSWDVFETIQSALPTFIEAFFAGDNVGEFEPVGVNDAEFAKQATDYVNHIIKKRNPGFLIFETWLLDALISKIGIVRVWWDSSEIERIEKYRGITDDQVAILIQNNAGAKKPPQIRYFGSAQLPDGSETHDFDLIFGKPKGVCIDPVKPEQFIVSRDAESVDKAVMVGQIVEYTKSDLVEMGFDRHLVSGLSDFTGWANDITLENIRYEDSFVGLTSSRDGQLEKLRMFYGFIRADYDGDGVAELRRVFCAGNEILENEEVEAHEYCIFTPIPLPHRVIGMAYADPIASIQELNTDLHRQYVDGLYMANNPSTYVNMQGPNAARTIEDTLNNAIGRIIRGDGPPGTVIGPVETNSVAQEALQGIEWANTLKEQRIGVTRYNQGLDSDSLNKTATGITKIFSAAEKRQQMTLRNFAETGVKDLFRKVLRLTIEYQDVPDIIRLRDKFVTFDPSQWNSEMDVTINAGIGTGDKDQTLMHLMQFGQFMEKSAMQKAPYVTPTNFYNYGKMLLDNAKIKGGEEMLLTDPKQAEPPPPAPPDPNLQLQAQIEQAKLQQKQADVELARIKAQEHAMELQFKQAESQMMMGMQLPQQPMDGYQ